MNYYLATAMNTKNEIMQICIEISPSDSRFDDPIRCCTNASSRLFWCGYLAGQGMVIDRVASIKLIHGLVGYRGVQ